MRWHKKSGGKNSVFCDRMTTKDIDNNQKDNTMKKIIYLALIAVIMGFLPTGCEKEEKYNENPSSLSIDGGSVVKKKPQNLGTVNLVIFKVTLRRATTDRPRDHKNCGCLECFGFCDFEWFPDIKKSVHSIVENPSNNDQSLVLMQIINEKQAAMYILEDKEYFEEEFGIDIPLVVPKEALEEACFPDIGITVKEGVYHFVNEQQQIFFDKKNVTSYGYVIVDIEIQ